MHTTTLVTASAAVLLFSGLALAHGGTESGGPSGPPDVHELSDAHEGHDEPPEPDAKDDREGSRGKPWEASLTYEAHKLVRSSDLGGVGKNRFFNYFYAYGLYDITPNDRVKLSTGFYNRMLADETETGLRMDDLYASYSHKFELPEEFILRTTLGVFFPISYYSQKMSMVMSYRAQTYLQRKFFGDLLIGWRVAGDYYWTRYAQAEGQGMMNPLWHAATTLDVEYTLPMFRALSFGGYLSTGWSKQRTPNMADPNADFYGVTIPPDQPVQQDYGGYLFGRYTFPDLHGLRSDMMLAFGQGDPTLGYPSAVHDGGRHYYLFYRQNTQVFAALTLAY